MPSEWIRTAVLVAFLLAFVMSMGSYSQMAYKHNSICGPVSAADTGLQSEAKTLAVAAEKAAADARDKASVAVKDEPTRKAAATAKADHLWKEAGSAALNKCR